MQHLDEGTIHAWLDGQLPPAEAEQVQAHVESCAECAALVAAARGFVAASSRIMNALDGVPGSVLPARGEVPSAAPAIDDLSRLRAAKTRGALRKRVWWRHPGAAAAAAIVFVAVGSFTVLRRAPDAGITVDTRSMPASPAPSAPVDSVQAATTTRAPVPVLPRGVPGPATGRRDDAAPRELGSANASPESRREAAVPPLAAAASAGAGKARQAAPAEAKEAKRLASPEQVKGTSTTLTEARTIGGIERVPAANALTDIGERAAASRARSADEVRQAPSAQRATQQLNVVVAGAGTAKKVEVIQELANSCYDLQLQAAGPGPMAIATVRIPTRVRLDSTVAEREVDPAQYVAHDISAGGVVVLVLRWRRAAYGFDLFVERDGGTQRMPVVVGDASPTRRAPEPQPAGAPTMMRAVAVPCSGR